MSDWVVIPFTILSTLDVLKLFPTVPHPFDIKAIPITMTIPMYFTISLLSFVVRFNQSKYYIFPDESHGFS